ncbi:MAG: hypothetical protein NXI23_00505 [Bacteroidetes bacterium]|jgi:hypothetical protein|nr:hypothetical protein [Bacteroidota bacterium]
MKKTTGNIILVVVGLGIGLLLGEFVIRMFAPQKLVKPCFQNDSEVALSGVSECEYLDDWQANFFRYHVRLNNLGFRMDSDIEPSDKNLAVCLGDSFTYGWGVNQDDSFWGILKKTVDKFGLDNKFLNAGFPAYSTGHCTKALEKLSENHDVKKAIYFMYFNDLFDNVSENINYRSHVFKENPNGEIDLKPVQVFSKTKRIWHALQVPDWLYKNSHLTILLKKILQGEQKTITQQRPFSENNLPESEIEKMTKVSLAHLENLNQKCQEKGIELMIVWIPCWLELDLENDMEWLNNYPYATFKNDLKNFNFFDPTQKMNELLKDKNAKISDYYFGEGHYNKNGNQLYYQAIWQEILKFLTPMPTTH